MAGELFAASWGRASSFVVCFVCSSLVIALVFILARQISREKFRIMTLRPNHALQRTAAAADSYRDCKRCAVWPQSLSLGRWAAILRTAMVIIKLTLALVALIVSPLVGECQPGI